MNMISDPSAKGKKRSREEEKEKEKECGGRQVIQSETGDTDSNFLSLGKILALFSTSFFFVLSLFLIILIWKGLNLFELILALF